MKQGAAEKWQRHETKTLSHVSSYLDGDDKVPPILQEVVSVQCDNPGLVRLGNISKNDINHT